MIEVAPSVLSANFTKLKDEIDLLETTNINRLHIDVMDGVFVPNLSFGSFIIKQIRDITKKILDVHIMVINPESHIDALVDAGADIISFHYEATNHHDKLISYIKSKGVKVGIAINPSTNETNLKYLYPKLDQVIVMTVNPGFGGQKFLHSQINKIKSIKSYLNEISCNTCKIEIDGGVTDKNANLLVKAGADILVAGSYIFDGNYNNNINKVLENGK